MESKWGAGIPAAVPGSRGPCVGVVAPLRGRHGANSSRPPFPNHLVPMDVRPNPPLSPLSRYHPACVSTTVTPWRFYTRYVRHTGLFLSTLALAIDPFRACVLPCRDSRTASETLIIILKVFLMARTMVL